LRTSPSSAPITSDDAANAPQITADPIGRRPYWPRSWRGEDFLHASPSIANPPSNAICRALGFTLLGESEVEYPPGHALTVNDWRLDLRR
jgi:hypothetical protein